MRGQIVQLVRHRGFGFIQAERGPEIFFNTNGMLTGDFDLLTEGQSVDSDVEVDPDHPGQNRAVNVRVTGEHRA